MLAVEFSETPMVFIEACLRQNGYHMFSTYRILEEAERTFSVENPPYNKIKTKRKMPVVYQDDNLEDFIDSNPEDDSRYSMLREFQRARKLRKNAEAKLEEERRQGCVEQANVEKARADGTMLECQCCFDEYPMNRMVNCDNETSSHFFCKACAKQNAETVIGQSKYELICMAMEGCNSSFSKAQQ
jgi:TRIAD3 protein (E3 ubiquitin-protein ligase RNF216)